MAKKANDVYEIDGKSCVLLERVETVTRVREIPYKLKDLVEEIDGEQICRDVLIQRTDDQWTRKQKSRLIESIMADRPIGSVLVALGRSESQSYSVNSLLDGLQRTTAIVDYIHNRFSLDKKAKPLMCRFKNEDGDIVETAVEVGGKKFKQLPGIIQDFILKYRLIIYRYEGFSDEELDDVVYCVNNGKTPTPYQKLRFTLGSENMRTLQPICDSTLWEDNKNCKAKNDSILCCVIRSLMLLVMGSHTNLGSASIMSFADNDNFADNVKMSDLVSLSELIEQLAEIKYSMTDEETEYLDAVSIPHLIMSLKSALKSCLEAKLFLNILRDFWKSGEYQNFKNSGSADGGGSQYSADSVEKRQKLLDDYIKNKIQKLIDKKSA